MREVLIVMANLYLFGFLLICLISFVDWLFGFDKIAPKINQFLGSKDDEVMAPIAIFLLFAVLSLVIYLCTGSEWIRALYLTCSIFSFGILILVYGVTALATILSGVRNFFLRRKK
jgi:hypothetical protein